ncbi:Chemotaxis response regulator protein-glutamate methylesterase CheB [uncultured Leptolyngbya sp.]|uniref:protein-glutamate methylesterase n=2 Tax=Cyanophyceae TaxID=3028117 RepID=A0A6J4N9U2_9CYAN|nr:Chemotaxis response regulator protein-glutamate methylesterase CheB [uncultured Leptolyngbya sp.]CAA9585984.1 Chemotaxis response regulator protein-glutamate methylesterase CheB [uncultured Synechococcales cyanobacterium]
MAQQPQLSALAPFPNTAYDIVAVATSLGGLRALSQILSALPANFPVAIVVVQHLHPHHRSWLAQILSRHTALSVKQAEEGDRLCLGTVYIAPPNKHLLVNGYGILTLSDTARVHFCRPAANNLFESVATSFKERAIAVVLTGLDGDGATGVQAIKQMGGTVIAQDEATSKAPSMPKAAFDTGCVDLVLPLNEIASTLISLTGSAKVA